jgi:hypothetical protein
MTVHIPRFVSVLIALALVATGPSVACAQQTTEPPLPAGKQAAEPASPPAEPRAQLTETVGMLSGLYLYQTYLTIGLLADGKAERVYDEKTARSVLATVVGPLDAVDKQLTVVGKLAQTDADRRAVEQLRTTVALLRRQSQELTAFWDTGNPAAGARYEATRQEAWKQITALLGLNKK